MQLSTSWLSSQADDLFVAWNLLFLTSWGRFQRHFDNIIENLTRHGELIDKEAGAYHISEAHESRRTLEAWRQESLSRLAREDKEYSAKQLQELATWLKVDVTDQISILNRIVSEGSKYPGTCSWVLSNTNVSSWLKSKPETPFLVLHGNPGSGKSVISGQLFNFLNASKISLRITHFCTYTYANSLQYDFIIRSLVFQLVRRNDDLIAHVHQEHVIGKAIPNISVFEKILLEAATALTSEPGQDQTVHVILDGLDEVEADTQRRLVTLLSKVSNRARSNGSIFKVLISCRMSSLLQQLLRRWALVSLSDEKRSLHDAISTYSKHRLDAMSGQLAELQIFRENVRELAQKIATKADGIDRRVSYTAGPLLICEGMFLWARLVLDHLSRNLIYNRQEFETAVDTLPRELSELSVTCIHKCTASQDLR